MVNALHPVTPAMAGMNAMHGATWRTCLELTEERRGAMRRSAQAVGGAVAGGSRSAGRAWTRAETTGNCGATGAATVVATTAETGAGTVTDWKVHEPTQWQP